MQIQMSGYKHNQTFVSKAPFLKKKKERKEKSIWIFIFSATRLYLENIKLQLDC